MMNGGRQQIDEAEHAREQELQQPVDALDMNVDKPFPQIADVPK